MSAPRWTITALTIPGRENYLKQLIQSLEATVIPGGARLVVVFNRAIREDLTDVEETIRSWGSGFDIEVHFNNGDPTISGGRNYQLNLVRSPLVCFVDDDITVHGDVFATLEEAMQRVPAGLFGLRSLREDTEELFKPRDGTPHVITPGFRYQSVQGMLVASFTNLLRDVGGFNPRRRFWGEWTELNLRMWRSGFPSGYVMTGGYLRHWEKAPDSPTRNMDGRAKHVLWGLSCTALEYDAVDMSHATETFWRLVQDRYLAYSFGVELSHQELLRATLELVPDLSAEWASITAFRDVVATHPFDFKPFQPLTEADLQRVLPTTRRMLRRYRWPVWPRRTVARKFGAALGKLLVRPPRLALEPDEPG
jgi:glycosyltransferase involved in cell wall biosynthesis